MWRAAPFGAFLLMLPACSSTPPFTPTNVNPYHYLLGIDEVDILTADRFAHKVTPDVEPLYCYRTLAQEECTRAPQPSERNRLRGYYGVSPEAPPASIRRVPAP